MFNIAKKLGWETFWDSVKFTWDSTFVDALGPRDAIEIKPKSNTGIVCLEHPNCCAISFTVDPVFDLLKDVLSLNGSVNNKLFFITRTQLQMFSCRF